MVYPSVYLPMNISRRCMQKIFIRFCFLKKYNIIASKPPFSNCLHPSPSTSHEILEFSTFVQKAHLDD